MKRFSSRLLTLVALTGLVALVASAQAQIPDHLKCYKVKDPLRLKGVADIGTMLFGLDPGCTIYRAKYFCTPATKNLQSATNAGIPLLPLPLSAPAATVDRICYKVKCPAPLPPDTPATDQFGTRTLGGLKVKFLCTPATEGASFCGDGILDPGEECDGSSDLACSGLCQAGCTCPEQVFPATGQTTAYTADKNGNAGAAVPDDGTIEVGATLNYVDNGDGTITDLNTGLMWEKKSDDGGLHDMDNKYPWSDSSVDTLWDWLDDVNLEGGTGFAGYNDWRLPNVKELQSIVDYERYCPSIHPVFNTSCTPGCTVLTCSCTAAAPGCTNQDCDYTTSSTRNVGPSSNWMVFFNEGLVDLGAKSSPDRVRAVRGGL